MKDGFLIENGCFGGGVGEIWIAGYGACIDGEKGDIGCVEMDGY